MTKKISISHLPEFDMAEQIKTEADMAAYLNMVIEDAMQQS